MTKQDFLTFLMWDIEQIFLNENYFTRSEIESHDLKSKFRQECFLNVNQKTQHFMLYIK